MNRVVKEIVERLFHFVGGNAFENENQIDFIEERSFPGRDDSGKLWPCDLFMVTTMPS